MVTYEHIESGHTKRVTITRGAVGMGAARGA